MKQKKYLVLSVFISVVLLFFSARGFAADDVGTPFDSPAGGAEDTTASDTTAGAGDEATMADSTADQTAATDETSNEEKVKLELPAKRLIKVVQKRLYKKDFKHLLLPYYNVMPFGDFYTTHQVGLKYDFFFTENMGLQLNFAYTVAAIPTDLLASTLKNLRGDPQGVPAARMDYIGTLEFVFVPIYGKFSLFAELIAHYDFGIYIGGGVAQYSSVSSDDISYINKNYGSFGEQLPPGLGDSWNKIGPALDVGAFAQLYILNWLVLRVDFTFVEGLTAKRVFDVAKQTMTDSDKFGIESYMLTLGVGFLLPPE